MLNLACSLHPMDVQLLKVFVAAIQGDTIPEMVEAATRRRQRDILLNWSRKIVMAAGPLASDVPREDWVLFTRLRPFFITAAAPEQVAQTIDRLYAARSLEDVLFEFHEEVANISAEKADAIIDAARQDLTPGVLEFQSTEEIAENMRAYLAYQRAKLVELQSAAHTMPAWQLADEGRRLAWRAASLIANCQPWWYIRGTALSVLSLLPDLGIQPLVADPRGMFRWVQQQMPTLYDQIPYSLQDGKRTGLCVTPADVPALLARMESWPTSFMPHPPLPTPAENEVRALREALIYAEGQGMGLWEASDLAAPEMDILPVILANQGERDEAFLVSEPPVEPAVAVPASGEPGEVAQGAEATPAAEASAEAAETPEEPAAPSKLPPFLANLLSKKPAAAKGPKPAKVAKAPKPKAEKKPAKAAKPKAAKPAKESKPVVVFGITIGGKK